MVIKDKIQIVYMEFFLFNGWEFYFVFEFIKKLKIEEGEFYQCFFNLDVIRQGIFFDLIEKILNIFDVDFDYVVYLLREKMFVLYYMLFEQIKLKWFYLLVRYKNIV